MQKSVSNSFYALHFTLNIHPYEFVIHLSLSVAFCQEKKQANVLIEAQITTTATKRGNQTHGTIQQCSFAGRWMCLPDDDCLGAAGCVASAMMMYAHLPWLLASSLQAETVGGRGKREGQDRMEVGKRGTGREG